MISDHDLAIDQERCGLETKRSINDGREAVGPVMTVAGEAADAGTVPISWTQSGPEGGRNTFDGRQGLMKPEDRCTIMGDAS